MVICVVLPALELELEAGALEFGALELGGLELGALELGALDAALLATEDAGDEVLPPSAVQPDIVAVESLPLP